MAPHSDHATQLAQQFRAAFFGKNWCGVSLQEAVVGLTAEQATRSLPHSHSIAELVFHIGYYVEGVSSVLEDGPLLIKDKYKIEMSPIQTASDWHDLLEKTWRISDKFIQQVNTLADDQLSTTFVSEQYGTFHQNLTGILEHLYYHLGQIQLIKKELNESEKGIDKN